MALKHTQIYAPASLVNSTGKLIFLIHNIFTMNEIQAMIADDQWMDTFGKPAKRYV